MEQSYPVWGSTHTEKSPSQFEARPGLSHRAIQCYKPRRFEGLLNTTQLAPEPVQRRPTTEPPSRVRECAQIISGGLKTKSPRSVPAIFFVCSTRHLDGSINESFSA